MSSADYARDLLRSGIIDAKTGNSESARRYLDRAIYMAESHDVLAEAWFWMSEVMNDPVGKRKALENCLSHDVYHTRARRSLAILDGRIKADEIVNPDKLPAAPEELREAQADRFMCPKCGGRMSFSPDGSSLVCDYCSRDNPLGGKESEPGNDFITAMATMKGHGKPLQEQVFHCNGCGAEFILPPKQISATCAYCASPHVVSLEKSRDLVAPDTIIPHAFDQRKAVRTLVEWVEQNEIKPEKRVELPRGVYLPMWIFDIGGMVNYTAEIIVSEDSEFNNRRETKVVRINEDYPVMESGLALPASRKLSAVFMKLIPTFDLDALLQYDPRYLSGWLAEVYDVPMGEASLDARSMAFKEVKKQLPHSLGGVKPLRISSAGMLVESFKLALLPVWMTELPFDGRKHLVLINGQSGLVKSDLPEKDEEQGGLFDFLADLLND